MEAQAGTPTGSGELAALVASMSWAQRLRFKQAVVQQAIDHVSKALPPEAEDEGHRLGILAATGWLREPTEREAREVGILAAGECWDGGIRYYNYSEYFLWPAFAAAATDVCEAARYAARAAPAEEQEEALRWQLATARAILRGEVVPLPGHTGGRG